MGSGVGWVGSGLGWVGSGLGWVEIVVGGGRWWVTMDSRMSWQGYELEKYVATRPYTTLLDGGKANEPSQVTEWN